MAEMITLIPTLLSLAGLGAGALGLTRHAPLALLASLALDVADGEAARRLDAVTEGGAVLDRTIDATLAGAIAWTAWHPLIVVPIIWTSATANRYSGRAVITLIACLLWAPR